MAPHDVPPLHRDCIHLSAHVYSKDLALKEGQGIDDIPAVDLGSTKWQVHAIWEMSSGWQVRAVVYRCTESSATAATCGNDDDGALPVVDDMVVALRGTDPSNYFNLLADGCMAFGQRPPMAGEVALWVLNGEVAMANELARSTSPEGALDIVSQINGTSNQGPGTLISKVVAVTGHSLGASMASIVGAKIKKRVVALDNPGVQGLLDKDEENWLREHCVNYLARPNLINVLMPQIGSVRQLNVTHVGHTSRLHTAWAIGRSAVNAGVVGVAAVMAGPTAAVGALSTACNALSLSTALVNMATFRVMPYAVLAKAKENSPYGGTKHSLEKVIQSEEFQKRLEDASAHGWKTIKTVFKTNPLKKNNIYGLAWTAAESTTKATETVCYNMTCVAKSTSNIDEVSVAANTLKNIAYHCGTAGSVMSVGLTTALAGWGLVSAVAKSPANLAGLGKVTASCGLGAVTVKEVTTIVPYTLRQHSADNLAAVVGQGYRSVKKWPCMKDYLEFIAGLWLQGLAPLAMVNPCTESLRNFLNENAMWEARMKLLKNYKLDE